MVDELREDQDFMAFFHQGLEQIQQRVDFGAFGLVESCVHQRGWQQIWRSRSNEVRK